MTTEAALLSASEQVRTVTNYALAADNKLVKGISPLVGEAERRAACIDGWSEISWGSGLVPRGLEDAPPSEGGMYKGFTPPADLIIGT
jgi:hypothetical protein